MGAVRPARARRREAVGLRYRWRRNPRLHPRWHRGSSRNYQGSDRSRRLISRRVYRGAQRMLTLQKRRRPELSVQQFDNLFAEWNDRYQAREAAKAAETPARLAALWAERDALFEKRASLPSSERADVDARIAAIGHEIATLAAPQR